MPEKRAEVLVTLFDMHTIYAIMFYPDDNGATSCASKLLSQTKQIVMKMLKEPEMFKDKPQLVQRFFYQNSLYKELQNRTIDLSN